MASAYQSEMKEMTTNLGEIVSADLPTSTVTSPSTLQDLPIEVLDDILMKSVIKNVMDKKLAKSAWIDCAFRVIGLIRTVSSQWNYSLTTNWFEIVLRRNLDNCKDPTTISVERIGRGRFDWCFRGRCQFGRLNNKIYCLHTIRYPPERVGEIHPSDSIGEISEESYLRVFEGQDMLHSVKDIGPLLPSMKHLGGLATCNRSNSIYIYQSSHAEWPSDHAIWRLVLDGTGGFEVLQWPTFTPVCDGLDCSMIRDIGFLSLCVLDDGNLLALRSVVCKDDWHIILSLHKPDGLVMRNIKLFRNAELFHVSNVTMKSNGNFVYAQVGLGACFIREVDENGRGIHEFRYLQKVSGIYSERKQIFLDANDRVIFHDGRYLLTFLDCELNFLGEGATLEKKLPPGADDFALMTADFDKETNEMIVMHWTREDVLFLKLTT